MAKAQFRYHKKFEEDYNPYGTVFTERQDRIIRGVDINTIRLNEIKVILKKAERMQNDEIAMQVVEMYEELLFGREKPRYTVQEAKAILQALTPWEIKWN